MEDKHIGHLNNVEAQNQITLLYVLVSSPEDIYLEQAYVSMYSAKKYMPSCHIILVTDRKTEKSLTGIRKEELKYADEIVVVDLDFDIPAKKRSRILKTNTRNYVAGDFIFVDCDTIIVRDFSSIKLPQSDISACQDSHSSFDRNPYRAMCIDHVKKLGLDIATESVYFNSGILCVKDTPFARKFFKIWQENYLKGYEKGVSMDQPSFCQTNIQLGRPVEMLPDTWNCELKHGIKYLKDALIVHYLCTNPSRGDNRQFFVLNERSLLERIKRDGLIPDEILAAIEDPFKGVTGLSLCLAGAEIDFMQTKTYSLFLQHYLKHRANYKLDALINIFQKIYWKIRGGIYLLLKPLGRK